jgi:hypothetical protein
MVITGASFADKQRDGRFRPNAVIGHAQSME